MEQDNVNSAGIPLTSFNQNGTLIQPNTTIINLNLLNQGLVGNRNGTYIFDPGQNLVYQAPMGTQPYITIPDYSGQTMNNYPLSISVPVQNLNCPSFLVADNNLMERPSSRSDSSNKVCPLKMSIKAAEIDVEYEQSKGNNECYQNGTISEKQMITQNNSETLNNKSNIFYVKNTEITGNHFKNEDRIENVTYYQNHEDGVLIDNNTPVIFDNQNADLVVTEVVGERESVVQTLSMEEDKFKKQLEKPIELRNGYQENVEHKFINENQQINQESTKLNNTDQESMESQDYKLEINSLSEIEKKETESEDERKPRTVITWDMGDEGNNYRESLICEVEESNGEDSSSDETDEPLSSMVLKLRKVKRKSTDEDNELPTKKPKHGRSKKTTKEEGKRPSRNRKPTSFSNYINNWTDDSAGDNEQIVPKISIKLPKPPVDGKVLRSCCSKKQCFKSISKSEQRELREMYNALKTTAAQDKYLSNCMEYKNSTDGQTTEEDCEPEHIVTQQDIENESNGNQFVSDEIQQAINESLRDCLETPIQEEPTIAEQVKPADSSWVYFLNVDGVKNVVCIQFLVKLFNIKKKRIKEIQQKILAGIPLEEAQNTPKVSEKYSKIWSSAKEHIATYSIYECKTCQSNEKHKYFENRTINRKNLFEAFQEFFKNKNGKELKLKYESYRRFLLKETRLSFLPPKTPLCAECESLNDQKKRLEAKKKRKSETDSSDDDEPLSKRKATIKMKISTKSTKVKSKTEQIKKRKLKEEKQVAKGRDVWSLMLMHLESIEHKELANCLKKKRHKYFSTTLNTQKLYEEYRKYFLKETNSELGLGYSMYEKYFDRNCGFIFMDVDSNVDKCPQCEKEPPLPEELANYCKTVKNKKSNIQKSKLGKNNKKKKVKNPVKSNIVKSV